MRFLATKPFDSLQRPSLDDILRLTIGSPVIYWPFDILCGPLRDRIRAQDCQILYVQGEVFLGDTPTACKIGDSRVEPVQGVERHAQDKV